MECHDCRLVLSDVPTSAKEGYRGALLELVVGDAPGTASESKRPRTWTPIIDMVGVCRSPCNAASGAKERHSAPIGGAVPDSTDGHLKGVGVSVHGEDLRRGGMPWRKSRGAAFRLTPHLPFASVDEGVG